MNITLEELKYAWHNRLESDDWLEIADTFWGIICNASGSDWKRESLMWQTAAKKARTRWHRLLKKYGESR